MSAAVEHPQAAAGAERGETKKTIAFDTWCLGGYARNQGVHVYAAKLLQHFRELAPEHGVEIAPYVSSAVDNDANLAPAAPGFRPQEARLLRFGRLWRFGGACVLARLDRADLVFSPHCTSLYVGHVVTIHDLIPLFLPVGPRRINQTLRFCLWWSAKFSRAIITDSFHSKQDLVNTYKLPEDKVAVVYLAHEKTIFNSSPYDPELHAALSQKIGIRRPYILHHGVMKPNKNLKRLIEAYHLLLQRNRNLEVELVLVGSPGWQHEDLLSSARRGPGRVIFAVSLNNEDLALLLKGATLAVFPSLYEGFCLPMLEAMACGVPTIASNSSCLPEISGGVLRYFHPESIEEMSTCIEEALDNSQVRRELSEKGVMRAREFDWRHCAGETLAALKQQLATE